MALHPCAECQKEVSDKALACPHCGMPQRGAPAVTRGAGGKALPRVIGVVVVALLGAAAAAWALRRPDYSRVEELRGEQDAEGTHDEHVRQRFFRLYKAHPDNAMYIYLWARCVDDAAEQERLANQGIAADPRFSWSYNMAARALARQNRVAEAYAIATKGGAIDPGNLELTEKLVALKTMLDHKLPEEARPAPNGYVTFTTPENVAKSAVHYRGLFRAQVRTPDPADVQAIGASRFPDAKLPLGEAVHGLLVCANPYADACVRVYVPRDDRFKGAWPAPAIDVTTLKEHRLVTVSGAVVTTEKGEPVLIADAIEAAKVEAR